MFGPIDESNGGLAPFSVGDEAIKALQEVRRDVAWRDVTASNARLAADKEKLRRELLNANREVLTTQAALEAALEVNTAVIHEIAGLQAGTVTEMRFSDPRRQELRQALFTAKEDEHLRRLSHGRLALDESRMAEVKPLRDLASASQSIQPARGAEPAPGRPKSEVQRSTIFGRRGGQR